MNGTLHKHLLLYQILKYLAISVGAPRSPKCRCTAANTRGEGGTMSIHDAKWQSPDVNKEGRVNERLSGNLKCAGRGGKKKTEEAPNGGKAQHMTAAPPPKGQTGLSQEMPSAPKLRVLF